MSSAPSLTEASYGLAEEEERRVVRQKVARIGMQVKVSESHGILERRGMVGTVVGRYGGDKYGAVDVRFPDGQHRLYWSGDLEEVTLPQPWWRSLLST